ALEADLAGADDEEAMEIAARIAEHHDELDAFEERYGRHRTEEILSGLGFPEAAWDRPVSELSGGWKMRAALAGLLLLEPDLLLLDEPTNHLDVPSLEWFDDFLRRSPKALLLVSHDRQFLDRQIARVLSFEPEGLRSYVGDYEDYRRQRDEEEENLELRAKRQAAQRAETERFIERFRYKATKARQVQSRVKQLAKEQVVQVRDRHKTVRFRFPEVERSGREVVRLEGVRKAFGDNVVYRGLDAVVARGDRISVIGVNGAGKTTLLRMIAGELPPDAGTIALGHNVSMAYFAQHHTELLDRDNTVLDEIWGLVPKQQQSWVRGILGAFLFSGDDVDKKIAVLSGGERARVSLARLLVVPSNLMLMDEPTNHLDLDSSERLVAALKDYGGTLLFVSHNKSFINQLATKVWDVSDGGITEWQGNLDAYLYHLQLIGRPMGGAKAEPPPIDRPAPVESDRDRRRREAVAREAVAAKVRPIKAAIADLERRIADLEAEKKQIEPKLADPAFYADFGKSRPLLLRYDEIREKLDELYARWEHQHEALTLNQGGEVGD
ncbi:MAG TPA: ABC-F family ATP-binding cassette domain-containing protein, partial [Haliangiales bacterium]|nr:ABC-F family ATP-binding cassette domain-containing protein [Haliangiales bacterium]